MAYKGLPFKSEWVDWPDIENVCKSIGAEPTTTKASGGPLYTVPFIRDPSTGAVVSDSLKIILYLEKAYPDTPTLFPYHSHSLQIAFGQAAYTALVHSLFHTVALATADSFSPASSEFWKSTRPAHFGEDFRISDHLSVDETEELWKALEKGFDTVSSWLDAGTSNGLFVMGDSITYGDAVIAGLLMWPKVVFGAGSEGWRRIESWNGGRWIRLLKAFEKYEVLY